MSWRARIKRLWRSSDLPPDLVAQLHGDALDPDVGEQLWPLALRDPQALRNLHALDEVQRHLAEAGSDSALDPNSSSAPTMPPQVSARIEAALGLPPTPPRTGADLRSLGSVAEPTFRRRGKGRGNTN